MLFSIPCSLYLLYELAQLSNDLTAEFLPGRLAQGDSKIATENVPFQAQASVGMDDIRGYF